MSEFRNIRVLFLDLDGVVNIPDGGNVFGRSLFETKRMQMIKQIIAETNAKLILSSNWRLAPKSFATAKYVFEDVMGVPIYGVTPFVQPTGDTMNHQADARSKEILGWLKSQKESNNFIEGWIAIDDLELDLLDPYFIKTDYNVGITSELTNKAITLLKTNNAH